MHFNTKSGEFRFRLTCIFLCFFAFLHFLSCLRETHAKCLHQSQQRRCYISRSYEVQKKSEIVWFIARDSSCTCIGYMFSCARCTFHTFPRFLPDACFPALSVPSTRWPYTIFCAWPDTAHTISCVYRVYRISRWNLLDQTKTLPAVKYPSARRTRTSPWPISTLSKSLSIAFRMVVSKQVSLSVEYDLHKRVSS